MAKVGKTVRSAAAAAAPRLVHKHYQRALGRWPRDMLRPNTQLPDILAERLQAMFATDAVVDANRELRQVNALYSLLEDRYKSKYRILGQLFEPKSNPTYYSDIITELEEAPKRTWLQRMSIRLRGMIRLS